MGHKPAPLFTELDATGRFHRDSAVGRIFHRGGVSFREICARDSLHISVLPGNRVSAHIDRVSPLTTRAGRSRYSVVRAVLHNLAAAADSVGRLVGGRRRQSACELACEIVWVPDEDEEATAVRPGGQAGLPDELVPEVA